MDTFSADLEQMCGCHWAIVGETLDEVTSKTKAHAKGTHGMNEVPAEIAQKLHAAVRPTMRTPAGLTPPTTFFEYLISDVSTSQGR
jgi:predicted small metal-binding protein